MITTREKREKRRLYLEKYRKDPKNKERYLLAARKYRLKNLEKIREYKILYRQGHRRSRKQIEDNRDYSRTWAQQRRQKCLRHYGGEIPTCKCCGESQWKFLAIDHVNGGGGKHRKEIRGKGTNICDWLIKNQFPEGFQILCHNCNLAKGFYGFCPHVGSQSHSKN